MSTVKALKVLCNGERTPSPFEVCDIPGTDPIFSGAGKLSLVSERLGIPILVKKCPTPNFPGRGEYDNQPITYLMIELTSGLAPPEWQSYVGSAMLARKDGKSLLEQHFECLWDYLSGMMDVYADGPGNNAQRRLTPQNFKNYWDNYKSSNLLNGPYLKEKYENCPSPFEM